MHLIRVLGHEERLDDVYRGFESDTWGPMVLIETASGELIGTLPHYVKHSPTGFAWSYLGSGPAELARCLLLDALGAEGRKCPACEGSGLVFYLEDGSYVPTDGPDSDTHTCPECEGGLVWLPYQEFKADVVAGWPEEGFRIERWQILAWLTTYQHNREVTP